MEGVYSIRSQSRRLPIGEYPSPTGRHGALLEVSKLLLDQRVTPVGLCFSLDVSVVDALSRRREAWIPCQRKHSSYHYNYRCNVIIFLISVTALTSRDIRGISTEVQHRLHGKGLRPELCRGSRMADFLATWAACQMYLDSANVSVVYIW